MIRSVVIFSAFLAWGTICNAAQDVEIKVDTNSGIIIGVVQGNVTFYEKAGSDGSGLRLGKVLGNVIIKKSDSPVAIAKLAQIISTKDGSISALQEDLEAQVKRYDALVEKFALDPEDATTKAASAKLETGDIVGAEQIFGKSIEDGERASRESEKNLVKRYISLAELRNLQWNRAGAIEALRDAADKHPRSFEAASAYADALRLDPRDAEGNKKAQAVLVTFIEHARPNIEQASVEDRMNFASALTSTGIAMHNQLGEIRKQSEAPRLQAMSIYESICKKGDASCLNFYALNAMSLIILYSQDKRSEDAVMLGERASTYLQNEGAALASTLQVDLARVHALQGAQAHARAIALISDITSRTRPATQSELQEMMELMSADATSKIALNMRDSAADSFETGWYIFGHLLVSGSESLRQLESFHAFATETCNNWTEYRSFVPERIFRLLQVYSEAKGQSIEATHEFDDIDNCLVRYYVTSGSGIKYIYDSKSFSTRQEVHPLYDFAEIALSAHTHGYPEFGPIDFVVFDSVIQEWPAEKCGSACSAWLASVYVRWIELCHRLSDAACEKLPTARLAKLPPPDPGVDDPLPKVMTTSQR